MPGKQESSGRKEEKKQPQPSKSQTGHESGGKGGTHEQPVKPGQQSHKNK